MKNLRITAIALVAIGLIYIGAAHLSHQQLTVSTIYGSATITEPVLIELIKSPAFERLKHIHQYGVMRFARQDPYYTRHEHSLGVFYITRLYGAPLEEQIAALLHDVSHTVFSHVGDRFFKSNYFMGSDAYQDAVHEEYLEKTGIAAILEKYGFSQACCPQAKQRQRCFDQKLPDLCADRIEYNLMGGLIDNLITKTEIQNILGHLHFENEQWFFDDVAAAKRFGLISITLTEQRWGASWSGVVDHCAALALQRACDIGLITVDDVRFSVDDVIWQKLKNSDDAEIVAKLACIQDCHNHYCHCSPQEAGISIRGKFSGTDPLVKTADGLCRLSEIDAAYKQEFERVKKLATCGWCVKIC